MADNPIYVSATISAQDTGTDWLQLPKDGACGLSVTGLSDSTIHLQRKRPAEADAAARDVGDPIISNSQEGVESRGQWHYRLYCKTGNYGTDSPVLELNS